MTTSESRDAPEGWASTVEAVAERRAVADEMIGLTLATVRYLNIDYIGQQTADRAAGPRKIDSAAEWSQPTWDYGSIHALDFGIEFEMNDGSVYSAGWDLPGDIESMFLGQGPLISRRLRPDADAAIWDVSAVAPWRDVMGVPITAVELAYEPWDDASYWCTGMVVTAGLGTIEVVLGEANEPDHLLPSADTLAVLAGPADRIRRERSGRRS